MTLSTLCDLIWVEIWDDCSPMANQATYRDIMVRLFLKGESPSSITYKGSDGKTHRLAQPGQAMTPARDKMAAAKELYKTMQAARTKAREAHEVVSPPDG